MREPLHVEGMKPKWSDLNQKFYKKNRLVHKLVNGRYKINFWLIIVSYMIYFELEIS